MDHFRGPSFVLGQGVCKEIFFFLQNEDVVKYTNLDQCIDFIANYMEAYGPFDGLLGFSQVEKSMFFVLISINLCLNSKVIATIGK
jgi:hypothetical protein